MSHILPIGFHRSGTRVGYPDAIVQKIYNANTWYSSEIWRKTVAHNMIKTLTILEILGKIFRYNDKSIKTLMCLINFHLFSNQTINSVMIGYSGPKTQIGGSRTMRK